MHAAANKYRNHRVNREGAGSLGERPKSGGKRWKEKINRHSKRGQRVLGAGIERPDKGEEREVD